jgi:hypothetical protein
MRLQILLVAGCSELIVQVHRLSGRCPDFGVPLRKILLDVWAAAEWGFEHKHAVPKERGFVIPRRASVDRECSG